MPKEVICLDYLFSKAKFHFYTTCLNAFLRRKVLKHDEVANHLHEENLYDFFAKNKTRHVDYFIISVKVETNNPHARFLHQSSCFISLSFVL